MNWLSRWWRKRQRRIDLQVLWPTLKEFCDNLPQARAAFFLHMQMDSAYADLSTDEKREYVEELK